tara:strand:+ start:3427 stop:4359 length:933 start_codon:yes stop_codon:yes gene_type:complete
MKLSIVSTLYFSSKYIEEFCNRIVKSVPSEFSDFEIILVNDGSPDDSLSVSLEVQNKIKEIKIIELSRNFGHHKAIMTGLQHAFGDYIFVIDIDLEEMPELLKTFWEEINNDKKLDVVYGVQSKRKGNFFEKISGLLYYYIYNLISDKKIDNNLSTVRLMSKKYVSSTFEYMNQDFYIGTVFSNIGFNQKKIYIKKSSTSKTTYTFLKKYHSFINSIFSSTIKPLYIIFYFGLAISFLCFIFLFYIMYKKLTSGIIIAGWSSIIVSIFFSLGMILSSLGVVSIYISKIFLETKKTPFTSIKKIHLYDRKK